MHPYPIGNGTLAPNIPREFAALMDALQLRGANTDALLQLERRDWERLLDFCDLAHLTLTLAQVNSSDFPTWVVRRLERNVADNALRYARVRTAYAEAAEALRNARISHLVLKGFTQAPDYVRNPRYRVQSDIDFYCPQNQVAKAEEALQEIGYKPVGGIDYQFADHTPTLNRPGNWEPNGNMYDPEMPPSIEVHFCLWNERTSFIKICDFEHFWERRVTRRLDDISFPALSPVDQLGYFALHVVRGIICGDWVVHHAYELAVFLESRMEDDQFWKEWETIHSSSLRTLEAIAFWLAQAWFSCTIHPSLRKAIESMPKAQREWLERFGGSPLEVMFRPNKDGRLLQLLLMQSWSARRKVLRNTMIPVSFIGIIRPRFPTKNRRDLTSVYQNRHIAYFVHLVDRAASKLYSTTRFLSHGVCLWLSRRPTRAQFLLFLAASFFLTSAWPHTSSCSTSS